MIIESKKARGVKAALLFGSSTVLPENKSLVDLASRNDDAYELANALFSKQDLASSVLQNRLLDGGGGEALDRFIGLVKNLQGEAGDDFVNAISSEQKAQFFEALNTLQLLSIMNEDKAQDEIQHFFNLLNS